jgi:hypothetical protein
MSEIDEDDNDDEEGLDIATLPKTKKAAMYNQIIERIFQSHWKKGKTEFEFDRGEIESVAKELFDSGQTGREKPKNLGDVIYSFRHRKELPRKILDTQPPGRSWVILGAGDARYRFRLNKLVVITPTPGLAVRKIPDATPAIILENTLNDEQALLARLRYNRLVDVFLGVAASSLQNHLRTKVSNYGQIEIDEIYVGVDRSGVQYVIPVQAKDKKHKLGAIQTIQDVTYCRSAPELTKQGVPKRRAFDHLKCRAVSAQIMADEDGDVIAMFELDFDGNEVIRVREAHYKLVPPHKISRAELSEYYVRRAEGEASG